jgi:hypothetical protein
MESTGSLPRDLVVISGLDRFAIGPFATFERGLLGKPPNSEVNPSRWDVAGPRPAEGMMRNFCLAGSAYEDAALLPQREQRESSVFSCN